MGNNRTTKGKTPDRTKDGRVCSLKIPQEPQHASSDLNGSSSAKEEKRKEEFDTTAPLLYADENIVDLIEHYIKLFLPGLYKKLKKAFERGHWVKSELPPGTRVAGGCLLGRVTLYKLQTAMHRDIQDAICAIFCTGEFEGGEAIFPDLQMKFR